MLRWFLLIAALTGAVQAFAQGYRFHEMLDGKAIPAVVKPKDLSNEYYAVKIVMTGELNFLDLYGPIGFGGGFDSSLGGQERQRAKEALLQAAGVYWTRGERVTVEGRDFLIAYRLDVPIAAIGGSRSFDNWAMENPLDLTLQLIRPDAIGRMSPIPSLSPEKMAKAVESFERTLAEEFGMAPGTKLAGVSQMAAKQTAALSNVKQISLAVMMYATDYNDYYPKKPSIAALKNVTRPYMKNDALWNTGNPNNSQFLFNPMLYGVLSTDVDRPAEWPMIYESTPWPDGRRAVGFVDGHAKLVSAEQWRALEKLLKVKVAKPKAPPSPKKKPK